MKQMLRIAALMLIFMTATAAWLTLGGVMSARTSDQAASLHGAVADLWGQPLTQRAPRLSFSHLVMEEQEVPLFNEHGRPTRDTEGEPVVRMVTKEVTKRAPQSITASQLEVDLALDQRRKGLMWFPLYDVTFAGAWHYVHDSSHDGTLAFSYAFPVADGVYDDFMLRVDGELIDAEPRDGEVTWSGDISPGDTIVFEVSYASRGMSEWSYRPDEGVGRLRDFDLALTTDFSDIDFPAFTLSPSSRERAGPGWDIDWHFDSLVTGHGMGMVMPTRIQPGPLAASMAFSAPISLALYMGLLTVLGIARGVELHPMNHVFIAGAFFSFHLLFGYTADHLSVEWAFGLSSVVSLFLTVSYLRLVAGPRFALIESGLAQLVYLVGFAAAHFFEGFTGLTVTVQGIGTLFVLMQLTGGTRWSQVFGKETGG